MQAWKVTARALLLAARVGTVAGCAGEGDPCEDAPDAETLTSPDDDPAKYCGPAPLVEGNGCMDERAALEERWGGCGESDYELVCNLGVSSEGRCCYVLDRVDCINDE